MAIAPETFRRVVLEDDEARWELVCGRLQEKPPMAMNHNRVAFELAYELRRQLDPSEFEVRSDAGHVRLGDREFYIPDVMVIPVAYSAQFEGRLVLEEYEDPLPLVVEVWSRSTAAFDEREKLANYQRRRDQEIWLVHPIERTVTAYRRAGDTYVSEVYTTGVVLVASLPGVSIDLARFRW